MTDPAATDEILYQSPPLVMPMTAQQWFMAELEKYHDEQEEAGC